MDFNAIPERFRRRILDGQCWLWQGARQRSGYGSLRFGKKTFLVHRFVFELLVGPIPDGLELHHKCGIRHCCNPDHLSVIAPTDHRHLSRKTHCARGHELTEENRLYFTGVNAGKSCCRICAQESTRKAMQRWRAKQKTK